MSYDFASGSRYIDGTFSGTFDSEGITLIIWMKLTAAKWDAVAQKIMIKFGNALGSDDNSLLLTYNDLAADRVSATSRTTGNSNANNSITAEHDDVWQVFIARYTNNALRHSMAGSTADSEQNTGNRVVGTALDSIRIGASAGGFSNVQGLLAEVAIFDKALSDGEINALRTGSEAGINPNLVAEADCIGYWSLDTDQASHPDESGNGGPTLTVNNAVFDADHPTISAGSPTEPENNSPMPDQFIEEGIVYPPFDVTPYWIGTLPITYTQTGLPNGLVISTAGVISGTPTGGFQS